MRNKIKKNRWISWILTLAMLCSLLQTSAVPAFAADAVGAGVDIPSDDAGYTAIYDVSSGSAASLVDGGTYKITGHATNYQITVPDSANVTLVLDNVTITHTKSPLVLGQNSTATLVLLDRTGNTLICTATDASSNQTAGVLVPDTAKLIVDSPRGSAGTGVLNVTGGYGGAGIGGSAASGYGDTRNNNGIDAYIFNRPGYKAQGGQGGRNGIDAAAAGTITINAGTVNATGGQGGAGIGGGMGATGENGAMGAPCGEYNYLGQNWHSHTGGSGGGAGGNGGRGGRGGIVTINGGTVVAKATQYTVTKVGDMTAAGIGGGSGGLGGSGAAGHVGHYSGFERSGGNGGYGQAGYVNYSGDGGTLTINGGKLLAVGKHGSGASQNPVVVDGRYPAYNTGFNLYANSSKGYGPCDGGRAGEGGTAIQPTVTVVQTQIKIANSNNNVRFLDSNNSDVSVGSQPTDQLSTPLYQVALTVRNKADNTLVSNANVAVAVNKDDAARKYSYKTVSDDNGIATLWLPKGEYTLTYFDVSRNDVGIIQQGDGVTFNVEENNNNAAEVKIGLDMTASASVPNSSKVYINDTTTVDGAPSSIKIDTTKTHDSQLGDITWFREPVNGNTQDYALYQTVSLPGFDTGFTNVTKPEDKGTLTVTPGAKQAELKVLENGRYWLKIPMTVTDPNDPSKSMTVNLIRLVEVKNIYRSFPIQVKHQDLDRNGDPHGQAKYQNLTYGNGAAYNASYGFAWDLHGYKADDMANGTLLDGVTSDTVDIYALNTRQKAKWYEATLGSQKFTRKADRTDYEKPITLTLDQAFLSNSNADMVGGKRDISKYTINYSPDGVPVAEVTIRGIVLNDDGTAEKEELWRYDNAYPEGVTEATVTGFAQKGYRIEKVLVNGQEKTLMNGNSIHIQNLQGTQDNNYNDAVEKVEFVYVSNMIDVTVNCVYNGTTIHSSTISLEKGVPIMVSAPTIEGYTSAETGTTITPDDTNKIVTFTYTKNAGNVTVVAVDAGNGNAELYRKDGGIVDKGNKITLTGAAAVPTIQYYTAAAAPTSVTVNGVEKKDELDTYQYEGNGDIVVTYAYTRNTRDITVIKKDADSGDEIGRQTLTSLAVGKSYTFGTDPAVVESVTNYTAVTKLNPTTHFLEDKDGQTVTFYYQKNENQRYVTVTVNLQCDEDGKGTKTFRTYTVTAIRGAETTIKVPDMTGMGYTPATGVTDWTGKPDDNEVVNFQYVLDGSQKTVTVKLLGAKTGGTGETDLTAPTGYQNSYLLKKGESVTIQVPHIDGYDPVSAELTQNGMATTLPGDKQKVTVSWNDLTANATVTFHYAPKSTTSFVTHTIKFVVQEGGAPHEVYSYSKLIPKGTGTGNVVKYAADDVKYTLPGYAFDAISYAVDGKTNPTEDDVTNVVNATITYYFTEDAAQIVIKQNCNTKPDDHSKTVTLTGYRKGQTGIKVMAPLLANHALAPGEPTFKIVGEAAGGLKAGANEVTFNYVGEGDLMFKLIEVEIDDSGTATEKKTIQLIKAETAKTYNPTITDNALDLSDLGYTFVPCNLATDPFKTDAKPEIQYNTPPATATTYTVCYTKKTRDVDFVAVDKSKLDADNKTLDDVKDKPTELAQYTINVTPETPEKARVGETYKAVAQSFNGWALRDDYSKNYEVADENSNLKVYFMYVPKATGTVVIKYNSGTADQDLGQTLNEYSFDAVSGEKVSITPPTYILNGKYKLRDGQGGAHLLSVEATAATEKNFYYEPNFVTVTVKTVTDGGQAVPYATHEVNKTDGNGTPMADSLTLTPPNKAGYTLVGIIGVDGGSQTTLPTGFNGSIQLTGWDADKEITYYYAKTTAAEYQYDLTVKYLYNNYPLATEKSIKVSKDQENSIEVPTFDGYQAKTYQLNNGGAQDVTGNTVSITPTADGGTLVIHYGRTDGTIVLPGKDDKIPAPEDKDNVIVKPGDKTPTIDGDGNVKIDPDDNNSTVIRPIDPANPDQGKEEIKVPGGTVIKPDGSIVLPTNPDGSDGGTINPNDKLPGAVPDGYRAVVYKANGGVGDDQINIYRNNEQIFTITNPFTNAGKPFTGWSTAENGVSGTNFGENAEVTGITGNVTLYAQWGKKNTDGSVELPGKDGILAAPNDKDNVIVTPDKPNGTLNGPNQPDGSVKVENGDATVTRPDPTDPNFPEGGKEEIKVPEGSMIYPDGTIKLPDDTIIKPGDKLPDKVISNTYAIVTYEPNGGSGNVIHQMIKKDAAASKALSGDVFTAPRGMIFEQWKNVTEDRTIAAGEDFTPTKDLTLRAQWKEKAQTPTSYTAQIVFVSNTNDGTTHTQTITGINSKLITGQLDAYVFTLPADWKFMGWSTIKAASRHATVYADSATVTLKEGTTLKLYAILYQVDKNTKVVTLPGADGQLEGTDNVTVTPPAGTDITLGNGYVEAPKGSEITQPAGKIEVMEGTVIVYPDGSIYVPDGSQVKLPNGTTVNGEANIDKDGNVDKDKDKPIQKPDGTIVLPGEDKKTGTDDDIIVKPAGPNKPAGRIDEDGNVTITDPDGADVTFPGKNPENVKLPIGTVITPDGEVTLTYTLKYVDDKGKELETAELVQIKDGATEKVKALSINGYNLKGEAVKSITSTLSTALNDYIITFTYEKQKSDGGSGGSGGGGGGSVIVIGGGGGSSLNPQRPTIITDGNLKYTLSKDGSSASLTPNDGYEINSIIVNGEEKGGAEAITGLKTGDIVKISAICYLDVIEEAQSYKLAARSKQIKRKNGMHPVKVKVTWYDENGKELKLDGYEIERSRKRYSGYQLRFKTDREVYYNTYIENGAKYYYRVRGYILFKGEKYYTNWSKKAWRTVKM